VFRTLREIAALPIAERLDAFVDRLDLLDSDELNLRVPNTTVRLKILDVGKQWLHDAEKSGAKPGKLAALRMFDAAPGKKAAG
jgi:type IV pilus biogenesis protein CpaD/CtpE